MKRKLTSPKTIARKAQKSAARAWQGLVAATLEVPMKKQYDFKKAQRGHFAKKFPTLEVSFNVTQEIAAALRALRATGLFGNGVDCASIAEELLRRALLDPNVAAYWRKP
jgi:hypothetical protein